MDFELTGALSEIEVIASARGIRNLRPLQKRYGGIKSCLTEQRHD
jgi:hypothetical protein